MKMGENGTEEGESGSVSIFCPLSRVNLAPNRQRRKGSYYIPPRSVDMHAAQVASGGVPASLPFTFQCFHILLTGILKSNFDPSSS